MKNQVEFSVDAEGKAKLLVNGHDLTNIATSITIWMDAAQGTAPRVSISLLAYGEVSAELFAETDIRDQKGNIIREANDDLTRHKPINDLLSEYVMRHSAAIHPNAD